MTDRLDVIIFGATGYTGRCAIAQAVKLLSKHSWGIAGRNETKLKDVLKEVGDKTGTDLAKIPIIIADVGDEKSLGKMAERAKIIVNCCGPYRLYGEVVVKACVEMGAHHVDISGEIQYIESMQLKYNELAKEKGVYIISTCGFDSIPADMGVVFFEKNFDGEVNAIESYLQIQSKRSPGEASLHYGTWESAVYGVANEHETKEIQKELFPHKLPEMKPKLKEKLVHKDPFRNWSVQFPGVDRFVVQRTQRFDMENEKKRPIQYIEYLSLPSFFALSAFIFVGAVLTILSKFSCGRSLLLKHPRFFSMGQISHEGPSEESRKQSKVSLTFYGNGWPKSENLSEATGQHTTPPTKTLVTRVSVVDPGYGATGAAILLAATTILTEKSKMPKQGGVLTPAAAFAKTNFLNELTKNGYDFEVVSSG